MSNGPWTVEAPVFRRVGVPMEMEEVTVVPPRAGEVAVRLVASGVCHSCLHSIDGSLEGTPLPIILGDEGAGVVVEVGEGVTMVEPGDHAVISWAPSCGQCRECLDLRLSSPMEWQFGTIGRSQPALQDRHASGRYGLQSRRRCAVQPQQW